MNKTVKIIIGIIVIILIVILGVKVYKTKQGDEQKAKQEMRLEKKQAISEVKGATEKEKYLNELTNLKNSTSDLENGNVSEKEEVAESWNEELNKIYKVVDSNLEGSNKKQFRKDEKEWYTSKYDSMTEDTQMVAQKEMDIKTTRDRCYYLVNKYMK